MPNIENVIAQELGISPRQVAAVVALVDEGNTIPFIARYRKEVTGGLDDVHAARPATSGWPTCATLEARKADVLRAIDEQGKLADAELRAKIEEADRHAARGGPVQAVQEEARHPRLEGARRGARTARAAHDRTGDDPQATRARWRPGYANAVAAPTTRPRPCSRARRDIVAEVARRRRRSTPRRLRTFTRRQRLSGRRGDRPGGAAPSTTRTTASSEPLTRIPNHRDPRRQPRREGGQAAARTCARTPTPPSRSSKRRVVRHPASPFAARAARRRRRRLQAPRRPLPSTASCAPLLTERAQTDAIQRVRPEHREPALAAPRARRARHRASTPATAPAARWPCSTSTARCSTSRHRLPHPAALATCAGTQRRAGRATCGVTARTPSSSATARAAARPRRWWPTSSPRRARRRALHHRERGGRVGVFRLQAGERGIPRSRRHHAWRR